MSAVIEERDKTEQNLVIKCFFINQLKKIVFLVFVIVLYCCCRRRCRCHRRRRERQNGAEPGRPSGAVCRRVEPELFLKV